MHTLLADAPLPSPGEILAIEGEEAHHALRVKRLEAGAPLHIIDGRGCVAAAVVYRAEKLPGKQRAGAGWRLHARIERLDEHPRPTPQIHVCTGVPKGPRIETLIESLSQAGAASWSPLETTRSVVDPREGKLARLARVTHESAKQCGRAWALDIRPSITLKDLLADRSAPIIVADASGKSLETVPATDAFVLAVGPEGGFEQRELDEVVRAGATIASFGRHTMRIETAAPVACGILAHLASLEPSATQQGTDR